MLESLKKNVKEENIGKINIKKEKVKKKIKSDKLIEIYIFLNNFNYILLFFFVIFIIKSNVKK